MSSPKTAKTKSETKSGEKQSSRYIRIQQILIDLFPPIVVQWLKKVLSVLGNFYWLTIIKVRDSILFIFYRFLGIVHNLRTRLRRTRHKIRRLPRDTQKAWLKIWQNESSFNMRRLTYKIIYKIIILIQPRQSCAYRQLLDLWLLDRDFYKHQKSLGWGEQFLECFDRLWEIDSTSILDYRRSLYGICWANDDISMLENYAQKYFDTQEKIIKQYNLDALSLRFSYNPIFDSYNLHGYLDTHIKAMLLGWQPLHKILFWLPLYQKIPIANPCMLEYWKQYVDIKFVEPESSSKIIAPIQKYLEDDLDYTINLNRQAAYIEYAKCIVQKQWEKEERPPLFKLNSEDNEFGWNQLAQFGIPQDSWFVSLHVRDAGYYQGSYLAKDDMDSYRNADIYDYCEAIEAIVQRGGFVIRVGDPKMKPLPEMEGVFDYPFSNIYSNRMDIFLFSQCRFFVGVSSGPILTPPLFGVPIIATNFAPLVGRPHTNNCLFIPKLLWLKNEKRYATFPEALSSKLGQIFSSRGYKALDVDIMDNQPDELKDVILEMIDRLDGNIVYSDEDEKIQNQFTELYRQYSGYGDLGRCGRAFLQKYQSLL